MESQTNLTMTKNQYKKIEKGAVSIIGKSLDHMHDFSHARRVKQNAVKIAKILKLEKKIDLFVLKTACLFHDIAFTKRKASFLTWLFEGIFAIRILEETKIFSLFGKKDYSLVKEAIRHHGLSFPFRRLNRKRNLYCQILQDADTLDLFHEKRLESLRKSRKGNGFFYRFLRAFHRPVSRFGTRRIGWFLNFPQLAKLGNRNFK